MSDIPWDTLIPVIETGNEEQKIDIKESIGLSTKPEKADFAKRTVAIANTEGETGFIVIGVVDPRHRTPNMSVSEWMPGFQVPDPDQFQQQMVNAIADFIEPPFEIQYRQAPHPGTGVPLGIVIIPVSQRRPHVVKNDGPDIRMGQVCVRRGTQIMPASRQEIIEMCGDHWRPLAEDQQRVLLETYRGLDRDALDFRRIAESACRKLYHKLPRQTRGKVVRELLADFGREELFQEWFGEG